MSGKHVVLAGIGAGAVATAFLAGSPTRVEEAELAFSHANEATFDQNGVLHAIGTSFGRLPHANPADSGLVTLVWSPDAANYYSLEGGHQTGTAEAARLAASVICANAHPGKNATMWSKGKPGAWFALDLQSVRVMPSHFAYRNDYGGGGNHPINFQLQGSMDGENWTTLSEHSDVDWSGKGVKHWPVIGCSTFYSKFRILNQGDPNHLCCSGLELYGRVSGTISLVATGLKRFANNAQSLISSAGSSLSLFVPPIIPLCASAPQKIVTKIRTSLFKWRCAGHLGGMGASKFSGGDFLVAPGSALPIDNAPYTIELWVKPELQGPEHSVPVLWGQVEQDGCCCGLDIRVHEGKMHHFWWANDCSAPCAYGENEWMHVALTWDQETRKVYVNGSIADSDCPTPNKIVESDLLIGGRPEWGEGAAFVGEIADIRIWDRAITKKEFSGDLDTEKPPDTLVRWYRFGVDVTTESVIDLSKYKAHAQIQKSGDKTKTGEKEKTAKALLYEPSDVPADFALPTRGEKFILQAPQTIGKKKNVMEIFCHQVNCPLVFSHCCTNKCAHWYVSEIDKNGAFKLSVDADKGTQQVRLDVLEAGEVPKVVSKAGTWFIAEKHGQDRVRIAPKANPEIFITATEKTDWGGIRLEMSSAVDNSLLLLKEV